MSAPSPQTRHGFLITGTDTGIGKTVVSAMLVRALNGAYFKPVQAGLEEETDTEIVKRLSGLADSHFIDEVYRLNTPASPHLAAEIDGIQVDIEQLSQLPKTSKPLIVEGAGGVMVPLTPDFLLIKLFHIWQLPAIICTRTSLGTINHTLLTVLALQKYEVPIHGLIFVGDSDPENERIIPKSSGVIRLGRVPFLHELSESSLQDVFAQNFNLKQFTGAI